MPSIHLAFDLGASSGRAILGVLEAGKLELIELHRFEHLPCPTPVGPVWDLTGIWLNLLQGLQAAADWCAEHQQVLASVGMDAWGVDWCLVGTSGELMMLPHCYRDPQNEAACQMVLNQVGGREVLYQRNGIQLMAFNTLFQVAARQQAEPTLLAAADKLLFVPDLFHFWLSGNRQVERTIASTSAMLDAQTGDWDRPLLEQLGIPLHLLGPIREPGEEVGWLRQELADRCSIEYPVRVISPAAHDTAAAVAAVPVVSQGPLESTLTAKPADEDWAYLSSGTWSLLGVELEQPLANEESCAVPFTNERGVGGTVRFLKNIAGLWLLQELKRDFQQRGLEISFAEMVAQARQAVPFKTLVNPNLPQFASPGQIINKLQQSAREANQPIPVSTGELVRCCLESLAFCYRDTIERLESVTGRQLRRLFIVGGGVQNELLNQLTAAITRRQVTCGPIEATAIGNLLTQAMGCELVADLKELRSIVARSVKLQHYDPDQSLAELVMPSDWSISAGPACDTKGETMNKTMGETMGDTKDKTMGVTAAAVEAAWAVYRAVL